MADGRLEGVIRFAGDHEVSWDDAVEGGVLYVTVRPGQHIPQELAEEIRDAQNNVNTRWKAIEFRMERE